MGITIVGYEYRTEATPIVRTTLSKIRTTSSPCSIQYTDVDGNCTVKNNRIMQPQGGYGIILTNVSGFNVPGAIKVFNNMISIGGTSNAYGIYITGTNDLLDVVGNSVEITSTSATLGRAFYNGMTSGSSVWIRSNIFSNFGGGYASYITNPSTLTTCNYNDLYTTGTNIGHFNGTDYTTMTAWQSGSSYDGVSLNVDPEFLSSGNDLHIKVASLLRNFGYYQANNSTDFDGESRFNGWTDIGADENHCNALVGTYTIGGTSPDFPTFDSAVNRLIACGVVGPVVFNVRDGIYTEQISIPNIKGTSSSNTVTFQGENLDSTLVTLTWPSSTSSGTNYTLQFNGVDYIHFRDMTIERSGFNVYGTVIDIYNVSSYVTVSHCRLLGTGALTTSTGAAVVRSLPGTNDYVNTFEHNYVLGGSYGFFLEGESSTNHESSTRIEYNDIESLYMGIRLADQHITYVNYNKIHTTRTTTSYGIYFDNVDENVDVFYNEVELYDDGYGISLVNCDGLNSSYQTDVYNNIVTYTTAGTGGSYALYISGSTSYADFQHNSILVRSTSNTARAFYSASTGTINYVRYNNLINEGNGYAIYLSNNTAVGISSYNNLYTNGANLGYLGGVQYTDLASWQGTGYDLYSVSGDPKFVSSTDLHIKPLSASQNQATSSGTVLTDIDGELRGAGVTPPDIGSDEYTCNPLSGLVYNRWC